MVQFILFSYVMTGHKCWYGNQNYGYDTHFVSHLNGLGKVIIPKPNYVNFMRYSRQKPNIKDGNRIFATDEGEIDFTIEDLQFENYAKWVYEQIDTGDRYIVIGLDQGCHHAKFFANKYHENC